MSLGKQQPLGSERSPTSESHSHREKLEPSFESLIKRYEHDVRSVILSQVPNWSDAEDIYQETCVRLLEKREQWQTNSRRDFRAWAVTVAYYQVLTYRKTRGREQNRFSERAMELIQEEQIVSSLDNEMRVERLISCIARLHRQGQELLKLAYGRGLRLSAVAAELGRTEAATYKFHSRIRASLRACIERSLSGGR